MAVKIFRFGSKTGRLFLEGTAVLLGLFLLAFILLAWRLSTGPVDVSFARDYIEEALYDPVSGYRVELEGVSLAWPRLRGPLALEVRQVRLLDRERTILTIDEMALGLASRPLIVGHIAPVSITLKAPALRLIRTADSNIRLSIEGEDTGEEETGPGVLDKIIKGLASTDSKPDPRSPLALLQSIEVIDARMIVEDHAMGITWFLRQLDFLLVRDDDGLLTTVSAALPGGRDKAANIQAEAVYFYDGSGIRLDVHVQDLDPRIVARKVPELEWLASQEVYLNGDIGMRLGPQLDLQQAGLSLSAGNGRLTLKDLYKEPLGFEEMVLKARYDAGAGEATVDRFRITAQEVSVAVEGRFSLTEDEAKGSISIAAPSLPQEKIAALWPTAVENEALEQWLVRNLSEGALENVRLAISIAGQRDEAGWEAELAALEASFDIRDMTVDYRSPLKPATNVSGPGRYSWATDTLEIGIDGAEVNGLRIPGGKVTIDKIAGEGIGTANVELDLKGPLPLVFDYIADEPIDMTGEALGLDTKNIKGDADLKVTVSFPTVRDLLAEQVDVDVTGTLRDVVLPDVVKTLDLSGKAFSITVGGGLAALKGDGMLEGRPVAFDWQQYLESEGKPFGSRIKAKLGADESLRQTLGIDLADWIEGTVPVNVVYTQYRQGRSEAIVEADLKPARLMVKPFDHEKAPGIEGKATATALLRDGDLEEVRDLEVQTPSIRMHKARLLFDTVKGETVLRRGEIPRGTLNETDIGLEFEIEKNGVMNMAVKGAFLDARPFLDKDKERKKTPYEGPPLVISIDAERMRTEDTRLVTHVKAFLKMDRQGMLDQLEMDAVAGRGDVYLRLKPDEKTGKMTFRMEAEDAGATLRAFGVYENVVGGKLVIYGEAASPQENRLIKGNLQLSDFRIKNAPVLAQLINAISPIGLPQLLSGEGLSFARLESRFSWQMRPQGDLYKISKGRTSGSSLGLTFEGEVDKARGIIEIDGHVVPVSELNKLIGNIPIIGNILAGGKDGAVFAATYKITGPVDEPTVFVNPLAVLTPGIIRRILFEDPD